MIIAGPSLLARLDIETYQWDALNQEIHLRGPSPNNKHPMDGFPQVCFIKNTVTNGLDPI